MSNAILSTRQARSTLRVARPSIGVLLGVLVPLRTVGNAGQNSGEVVATHGVLVGRDRLQVIQANAVAVDTAASANVIQLQSLRQRAKEGFVKEHMDVRLPTRSVPHAADAHDPVPIVGLHSLVQPTGIREGHLTEKSGKGIGRSLAVELDDCGVSVGRQSVEMQVTKAARMVRFGAFGEGTNGTLTGHLKASLSGVWQRDVSASPLPLFYPKLPHDRDLYIAELSA